jgi:hypothetical protein
VCVLLVDRRNHPHFTRRLDVCPFQVYEGMHHGRQPRLGVTRPSPINSSPADLGIKRRNVHSLRTNRITMGFKHKAAGAFAWQFPNYIRATGENLLLRSFNPMVAEKACNPTLNFGFGTLQFVSRIDAPNANKFSQGAKESVVDH